MCWMSFCRFRRFMKGRVVHDNQVRPGQTRTLPSFEPRVERLASHRLQRGPVLKNPSLGLQCAVSYARISGRTPGVPWVDTHIATWDGRREDAFIDMDELLVATYALRMKTHQLSSLQRAALCVAGRFLPDPPHLVECVPDALA